MPTRRTPLALVRGLLLVAGLTAFAYLLARLPLLSLAGPLVLALIAGAGWRAFRGLSAEQAVGASFAARTLLRIGIVLLGVRLDFGLLVRVGPEILLGSLLVVAVALVGIERLGKLAGLPSGLSLAIAVGTAICGASAILAAAPTARLKDEEAGLAVAIISLLGTLGALAFALASALPGWEPGSYGFLVGFTLQEVGQVIAAGYVAGTEEGDLATVVKLTRVALLAPALLVLGILLRSGRQRHEAASAAADRRQSRPGLPVPPFLIGFLAVGALASTGWLPEAVAGGLELGSLLFTAAAMTGLGLGLRFEQMRRAGSRALLVGAAGFLGLVALMAPYVQAVAARP